MKKILFLLILISSAVEAQQAAPASSTWSVARTKLWYNRQPWLVGCNFIPSTAINELEMWQSDTWDSVTIDCELGWAASIGMNTARVFLHDLMWQDSAAFIKKLDSFLAICARHRIKPMLVLFDSVWDPNPVLGKQHEPTPGVHNSGWVQSPGAAALKDTTQHARLEAYVKGVVRAFGKDLRVLCWDIWNEPDNVNTNNYADPPDKVALIEKMLPKAFAWARAAKPVQPLTSGIWQFDGSRALSAVEKIQLEQSDIISFHCYGNTASFEKLVTFLTTYKRPMFCTEYLARGFKSTFETILPLGKKSKIAMYNWGLVKGKTQTDLPWDSWQKPYTGKREPAVWHHEIFYPDGKPYKEEEVAVIRELTKKTK